jgi:hypothetical protein
MKFKVGDRVKGVIDYETIYTGTVVNIDTDYAIINRDDGINGWCVCQRIDGSWGSDCYRGDLTIIDENHSLTLFHNFFLSYDIYPNNLTGFTTQYINNFVDENNNKQQKTFMENIKEKFVVLITPEPKKSFRKAGITDGDDLLTADGEKIFLTWLLHNKYADEFKKDVVDGIIKEKEEKA